MRKLIVFNNVTVDGYFTDRHGDMSWAHAYDPEWLAFVEENASGEAEFLFGRVTYEMMASYWPTPGAIEASPVVAGEMNSMPKVVFSETLYDAKWNNTRLVKGDDPAGEIRKMKVQDGNTMVIFGSGSIIPQLADEGLIDEYRLAVHPLVLGRGRTMFEGIDKKLRLKLTKTRTFRNGIVVLYYEPVRVEAKPVLPGF
jgi:dihydrofolate reductase